MLTHILDNSYVVYTLTNYKQNKGTPQGNNVSLQIAYLTLAMIKT